MWYNSQGSLFKITLSKSDKRKIIRENAKYNNFLLNQVTYTECLYIFSYALSIITTGSNDLNYLKSFTFYEKVISSARKHFITGYNQTINHSIIEILFLESRGLIFN